MEYGKNVNGRNEMSADVHRPPCLLQRFYRNFVQDLHPPAVMKPPFIYLSVGLAACTISCFLVDEIIQSKVRLWPVAWPCSQWPELSVWPYQTIITAAKKLDRLFWGIVMHEIRSNRLVL